MIATNIADVQKKVNHTIRPYFNNVNNAVTRLDERIDAIEILVKTSKLAQVVADDLSNSATELTTAQLKRASDSQFLNIESQMMHWNTSFIVLEGHIKELEGFKEVDDPDILDHIN